MDNAGYEGARWSENNKVIRRNNGGDGKSADAFVPNVPGTTIPSKEGKTEKVVIEDNVNMKKQIGLPSGVAFIVGSMIGSGIFISPKGILDGTGSVGSSLLVWTGCGLIAMAGALCFAELGTMIPMSGGEFAYLKESLGSLPAFFSVWIGVVISKTASQAINSLSFAHYVLTPFFDDCGPPDFLLKILAAATIITVCLVNCYSAEIAARVQVVFMVVKTAALCVIIVGGIVNLAQGMGHLQATVPNLHLCSYSFVETFMTNANTMGIYSTCCASLASPGRAPKSRQLISWSTVARLQQQQGNLEHISTGFEGSIVNPSLIALAFYDGLWAYAGWNSLNYLTEELKRPTINLPRSIMIGVPLVTVIYLLTNISYLTVLSKSELLSSPAVAVAWGERVIGGFSVAIPVAVAFSIFGSLNSSVFTGARLSYVGAREGVFPSVLSHVNVHRLTPWPSLIFTATMALILVLPGNVDSLINFASFTRWFIYGATFFGLLLMRRTHKDWERPYRVPLVIPAVMILVSIYLVVAPIIENPRIEFLYASVLISSGLIFYIPFVHFKIRL